MRRFPIIMGLASLVSFPATSLSGEGIERRGIPRQLSDGIVVDDDAAFRIGQWQNRSDLDGYVGDGYAESSDPDATIEYSIVVPNDGKYELRMISVRDDRFGKSVPVTVQYRLQSTTRLVDQRTALADGYYKTIGHYDLRAGESIRVRVSVSPLRETVYADAMQLVLQ